MHLKVNFKWFCFIFEWDNTFNNLASFCSIGFYSAPYSSILLLDEVIFISATIICFITLTPFYLYFKGSDYTEGIVLELKPTPHLIFALNHFIQLK